MSQPIVSITINHGLDGLIRELGASKGQMEKAARSATRKLQAWINTQLMREMARETNIKQKALRPRFKKAMVSTAQGIYASIWIGVNPFEAQLAGKPRKMGKKGVKVRSWMFDKAFVASIFSSQEKVCRRTTSRRFPVAKMMIPIAEQMEEILPKYEGPAARKFEEIFEHEIKFSMGLFK